MGSTRSATKRARSRPPSKPPRPCHRRPSDFCHTPLLAFSWSGLPLQEENVLMLVGEWTEVCRSRIIHGPEDVGDELAAAFGYLTQEALLGLHLLPDRSVAECSLIALGTFNVARATPRAVFRRPVALG